MKRGRDVGVGTSLLGPLRADALATPLWDGLELRPAAAKGRGVFATRPIAEGALITKVEGHIEWMEYDDDVSFGGTWYGVGHNKWVAPPEDSLARWVNHSCEPSARMANPRTIVAARNIAAGEEVTIDYATTEEDPNWFLECRCGSPACRGVVKGEAQFES